MKQKIYICTNDEQLLCAKLAKFIIEKVNTHPINSIEILHNRSFPVLKELSNQEYLRKVKEKFTHLMICSLLLFYDLQSQN